MLLLLTGFVVGLMIGLTSMGGAALMTPLLILLFHVRPVIAVGSDLAYGAITKVLGAWIHKRQGTVHLPTVWRLASGSVPGGLLGVLSLHVLRRQGYRADLYLRYGIGIALIIVAVVLIARSFLSEELASRRLAFLQGRGTWIWGALVGFGVGFTSVGSGSMIAPFLMAVYPFGPAEVVGTDVFHGAILVTVTASAHWGSGNVDWHLVLMLLGGSLPGVALGSYLAPRLPGRVMRLGLSVVLLITGMRLL